LSTQVKLLLLRRDPPRRPISHRRITKQRDHGGGDVFGFKLHLVEIDQDDDGAPIMSCVVLPVEISKSEGMTGPRLTRNQQTMFTILHDAGERGLSIEKWNDLARDAGIGKKRKADVHDIRSALTAIRPPLFRQR
jgi:hypothetical protein